LKRHVIATNGLHLEAASPAPWIVQPTSRGLKAQYRLKVFWIDEWAEFSGTQVHGNPLPHFEDEFHFTYPDQYVDFYTLRHHIRRAGYDLRITPWGVTIVELTEVPQPIVSLNGSQLVIHLEKHNAHVEVLGMKGYLNAAAFFKNKLKENPTPDDDTIVEWVQCLRQLDAYYPADEEALRKYFIPKIKSKLTPENLAMIALAVPGKGG
jgi:hypothetical protein